MKILSVVFDSHLRFSSHVVSIIQKVRPSIYALLTLKRHGVSDAGLVMFYTTVIRPVLLYACLIRFPYISREDMSKLERVQSLCRRIISPNTEHYSDRSRICGVDYLSTILEISCLEYVASIKQNPHHILYQLIPPATKDSHGRLLNNHSRPSLVRKRFFMRFS